PGGEHDRVHLVPEGVDADRARGGFIFADRLPVVTDSTLEQSPAQHESRGGKHQHHVIEHCRVAAQGPNVVARVVGHGKEKTTGAAEPTEMIEADAGKFGKSDGEDGEIDARDAEAKREKSDECAAGRRDGDRSRKADPGRYPEMHVKSSRGVGAKADI